MKYLALLFTFVSGFAFAGPYVSIINDFDLNKLDFDSVPSSFDDTRNDLRVGYSGKYGYIEYGQYGSGFDLTLVTAQKQVLKLLLEVLNLNLELKDIMQKIGTGKLKLNLNTTCDKNNS